MTKKILTTAFIIFMMCGCAHTKGLHYGELKDFEGFYSTNDVVIVNENQIDVSNDDMIFVCSDKNLEKLVKLACKDPKGDFDVIVSEHFEKRYGKDDKLIINGNQIKIKEKEKVFICKDSTLLRLLKTCVKGK